MEQNHAKAYVEALGTYEVSMKAEIERLDMEFVIAKPVADNKYLATM